MNPSLSIHHHACPHGVVFPWRLVVLSPTYSIRLACARRAAGTRGAYGHLAVD